MKVDAFCRRSIAAAVVFAACVAVAPGTGYTEDWAGLSKKLRDKCEKFNKDFKDMTARAAMTMVTPEGEMKMHVTTFKKGEKIRAEVEMKSFPGGMEVPAAMAAPTIVIGDADSLWMIHPMMGKVQVPSEEISQYTQQWYCDTAIPQAAEIVGSEVVGGRACHVVSVMDSTVQFAKLWFDKETTDLLKMEGEVAPGERITLLTSDFRALGPDRVPYKTQMYRGNDLVSTIIIETVEVNKGLSDDLFDVEKAASAMPSASDLMKKLEQEETTPQKEGKD